MSQLSAIAASWKNWVSESPTALQVGSQMTELSRRAASSNSRTRSRCAESLRAASEPTREVHESSSRPARSSTLACWRSIKTSRVGISIVGGS